MKRTFGLCPSFGLRPNSWAKPERGAKPQVHLSMTARQSLASHPAAKPVTPQFNSDDTYSGGEAVPETLKQP